MKIIKIIEKIISIMSIIGGVIIVIMMLLVCSDILLRQIGRPISGSTEIVISLLVLIVFFGIGYCALQEMHIRVDIIKAFPHLDRFTNFICIAVCIFIGIQCFNTGITAYTMQISSNLLKIPRYPFVLVSSFGMFFVAIAMILNELKAYIKIFAVKKEKKT